MATIFGSLTISDSDRVWNSTAGQGAIFDAVNAYVQRQNAEMMAAYGLFIERTTDNFKDRYYLPGGGGYLQRRDSQGKPGNVKASGSWDVAYPLEDFGASLGWNDVDRAYMTAAELERHVLTVVNQNVNTFRFELLRRLFKNTTDTFVDPLHGSLTIQPLANGDSVVYPPVLGSQTEATHDHYLESGYLYTAISDTNNPYSTIANELEEHFGAPSGGSNMAVFQPAVVTPYTRALTDFVPLRMNGINPGVATDQAGPFPPELGRIGRVIGYMDGSGVWVVEWRSLPVAATPFMLGLHLDAPKPIIRRIDPADTGLGDGLQLVSEDTTYPFSDSVWRHRFGLGAGNRLNGVVMKLAAGGTYTIPTAYA